MFRESLRNALKPGGAFAVALFFTVIINVLMLVSPFYMLQVYDRIIVSASIETLILISAIVVFLLGIYGLAEIGRRRVFAIAGKNLGDQINGLVFGTAMRKSEKGAVHSNHLQKLTGQLATLQSFLMNGSISTLFDIWFTPLFLLVLFLVHPLLGALALVGGLMLVGLAVMSEVVTRKKLAIIREEEGEANQLLTFTSQQSVAVLSMGLTGRVRDRWAARQSAVSQKHVELLARSGTILGMSRSLRQILQSAVLGLGAYLALKNQVSPGAIIAGSIIMGRALGPIDQCIGQWKLLINAQVALNELRALVKDVDTASTLPNPRPSPQLDIIDAGVGVPGTENLLFSKFRYSVTAGQRLAVIGESGVGKTALLQTLAGVWDPLEGMITLGGLNVHSWDSEDRGQYFGYCPQNIQLTEGTVAENIARYQDVELDEVVAAAQEIDAHERIMRLPLGYQTPIGPRGYTLSAGQQQLVGLARAVFGNPVVIMLDEPTANLDEASMKSFLQWLTSQRNSERVILAVTHDIRCLSGFTDVLQIVNRKPHLCTVKEYFERRNARLTRVAGQ